MVARSAWSAGVRWAALLLGASVLTIGCTSDDSGTITSTTTPTTTTGGPTPSEVSTTEPADPSVSTSPPSGGTSDSASTTVSAFVPVNGDPDEFDAADFAAASPVNQWLPLTPGYQSVRQGEVNKGSRRVPHRRVYTVTDVTKEIAGVRATLVLDQDFDGGELSEQAIDYLAQDSGGNVWYLGSYTEAYEGGEFVNANDAWLAGVDGAKAGILMMADPQPGMPRYAQATVPGEGTAKAEVLERGLSICVPFKCYTDVLLIQEDKSENTYFAPGAGGIRLEPVSGDPQETEELINLTQLSEQGLAELSDEARRLDEHARSEASDVFGNSAAATRPS